MNTARHASTADLCDELDTALVLPLSLIRYGGQSHLDAIAETVTVQESNQLVRTVLSEPGNGRVLVVDGGGLKHQVALVGDQLAVLALKSGWGGIIVHGLVRDIDVLASMPIGVWASGTWPRRGPKEGSGTRGTPLKFAGVELRPLDRVVADGDGVLVVPSV